jgi:CRP-like cAMP-binding protein
VDAREVLGSVPFFAEVLSAAELDALASATRVIEFDEGSPVIGEGDPSDTMYVLAQGSVSVSIKKKGEDRLVATLHAGEIVGEMSLLTGAPRAATVVANEPVVTIEIDRSALRPLFKAEPALFDRFAAMLEKRQSELDKLYSSRFWAHYSPPRANLATVIRTYFADLPDRAR